MSTRDIPPRKIHALELRLQYELRAAERSEDPEVSERNVERYIKLDRQYTNLTGKHYAPTEEAQR